MGDINLHIGGCANGVGIAVAGTASIHEDGRGEMTLGVGMVPLRWDLALLVPMLWEPLAVTTPEDDLPAFFEARQVVYDENRRVVGTATLVAEVARDDDGFACRGQVEAVAQLEPGERVASVVGPQRSDVIPFGLTRGAFVAPWEVVTLRGASYSVVTTVVLECAGGGDSGLGDARIARLRMEPAGTGGALTLSVS